MKALPKNLKRCLDSLVVSAIERLNQDVRVGWNIQVVQPNARHYRMVASEHQALLFQTSA
jgi:hypothetical protein